MVSFISRPSRRQNTTGRLEAGDFQLHKVGKINIKGLSRLTSVIYTSNNKTAEPENIARAFKTYTGRDIELKCFIRQRQNHILEPLVRDWVTKGWIIACESLVNVIVAVSLHPRLLEDVKIAVGISSRLAAGERKQKTTNLKIHLGSKLAYNTITWEGPKSAGGKWKSNKEYTEVLQGPWWNDPQDSKGLCPCITCGRLGIALKLAPRRQAIINIQNIVNCNINRIAYAKGGFKIAERYNLGGVGVTTGMLRQTYYDHLFNTNYSNHINSVEYSTAVGITHSGIHVAFANGSIEAMAKNPLDAVSNSDDMPNPYFSYNSHLGMDAWNGFKARHRPLEMCIKYTGQLVIPISPDYKVLDLSCAELISRDCDLKRVVRESLTRAVTSTQANLPSRNIEGYFILSTVSDLGVTLPVLFSKCGPTFESLIRNSNIEEVRALGGLLGTAILRRVAGIAVGLRQVVLWALSLKYCDTCACNIGFRADAAGYSVLTALMHDESTSVTYIWSLQNYFVVMVTYWSSCLPFLLSGFDLIAGIFVVAPKTFSVRVLLDKAANVNAAEPYGRATLYGAAWNSSAGIVQLLLERGADAAVKVPKKNPTTSTSYSISSMSFIFGPVLTTTESTLNTTPLQHQSVRPLECTSNLNASRPDNTIDARISQLKVCSHRSFIHLRPRKLNPAIKLKPPAKKKTVYVWECCQCSLSGINIQTGTCPECQTPRCAYCQTTKVRVR
ncbi:hypothetical protein B0O99DRAFT_342661 [Bisporella sp. PMI_857]|nr:hypothetical protein B0O99DRAFT_342661 [Bisporella sp. PMI_857]